jgi:Protein of unknown function (DUF2585)
MTANAMLDGLVPPSLVVLIAVLLSLVRRVVIDRSDSGWRIDLAMGVAIVLATVGLELAMGRHTTYVNGPMRLWVGDVNSDQNSQQLADPYTLSHVIHGALFYGLTHLTMRRASLGARLLVALTIEGAWEAYENTDSVINRYRAATIALGYYGDSVLNSFSDIASCLLGFVLASRFRWWWTVSWIVATELVLALAIRDNLTLNIVMLIWPMESIRRWQLGA